jgi:hypothetical protein
MQRKLAATPLAVLIGVLAATNATAQEGAAKRHPTAAVSILGLASIHPVDDAYVGGPYLDRGLGGVGIGAAVMLEFVAASGLSLVVEGSAAHVEVEQTGRLVDGGRAIGRLRDPMLAVLGGFAVASHATTVAVLAGAGYADGVPAVDGRRIDRSDDPAVKEGAGHLAFVSGLNVRRTATGRTSLVLSARYALVPRSRRAQELGVSRHIIRLGAGVSVQLGR